MGYPSDLTYIEWGFIKHHFEPEDPRGNACKHDRKQVVDAIFYWVKSGVQWRMLPNDFPPWKTVYDHYSRWNKRGIWEAMLKSLNGRCRKEAGRNPGPSYGIIDSQSAKTQYNSEERGIDGNKKVKGRSCSAGASGISLSTSWATCCMSESIPTGHKCRQHPRHGGGGRGDAPCERAVPRH